LYQLVCGTTPAAGDSVDEIVRSTVQFLLRRMQRKEDFPSMSRALVEINPLIEGDRSSSGDELAEVILEDYGLTSKLLKLVNSPFYARLGGEVTSISRAVVLLGFDQVRAAAYSLAYYSKMHSESASVELRDAQEAFICGLFQNLGENLVIYYFPEDYTEIRELVGPERADKLAQVTGVGCGLGARPSNDRHLTDRVELIPGGYRRLIGRPLRRVDIPCTRASPSEKNNYGRCVQP